MEPELSLATWRPIPERVSFTEANGKAFLRTHTWMTGEAIDAQFAHARQQREMHLNAVARTAKDRS